MVATDAWTASAKVIFRVSRRVFVTFALEGGVHETSLYT